MLIQAVRVSSYSKSMPSQYLNSPNQDLNLPAQIMTVHFSTGNKSPIFSVLQSSVPVAAA